MYWLISDETIEKVKHALIVSSHDANSYNCAGEQGGQKCKACEGNNKRDIAYDLLDSDIYVAAGACPDIGILSRGRVRELIICLMQHCDVKAYSQQDAKIITDFIKEFYPETSTAGNENV